MKPKTDKRKRGLSNLSIKDNSYDSNFSPSNLPDHILDELWLLATKQGLIDLCEEIETERFRRLEEEIQRRREPYYAKN